MCHICTSATFSHIHQPCYSFLTTSLTHSLTDLAEALPKGFTLEGGKATITPEKKAEIPSGGRLGQQLKTSGVFQGVFQPSTAAREEPEQVSALLINKLLLKRLLSFLSKHAML